MAFGYGWGPPPFGGMPDQLAQMRARQQQNRPLYAVMVDGEQAARNYFVPPGEKAIMFDKEQSIFYIKEVNEYNAASFEKYRYDPIPNEGGSEADYVTRAELNEILARITGSATESARQEEQQPQEQTTQRRRRMQREELNDAQPGI